MTKAGDRILRGARDALNFARGDTSKGVASELQQSDRWREESEKHWNALVSLTPTSQPERTQPLWYLLYALTDQLYIRGGHEEFGDDNFDLWDRMRGEPKERFRNSFNSFHLLVNEPLQTGSLRAYADIVRCIEDPTAITRAQEEQIPPFWFRSWGDGFRAYEHASYDLSPIPYDNWNIDRENKYTDDCRTEFVIDWRHSNMTAATYRGDELLSTTVALDVRFQKSNLAELWPDVFGGEAGKATDERLQAYRSGLPGRPTSANRILNRAHSWLLEDRPKGTLSDFATRLHNWHKESFPTAPQASVRTIENQVRRLWNEHKSTK